jgi:hypothetical protein
MKINIIHLQIIQPNNFFKELQKKISFLLETKNVYVFFNYISILIQFYFIQCVIHSNF